MHPCIYMHGWGCDDRIWEPLLETMGRSNCLTIDLNPYLSEASSTGQLLNNLRDATPAGAIWIGSSLGGTLSGLMAETFPKHVAAVITIGTNPCFVQRHDWPHAMDEATFAAFGSGLTSDPLRTCMRFQALATRGDRSALRSLSQLTSHLKVRLPALQLGLEILRETDLRPHWQNPAQPHLAMFGSDDGLVPHGAYLACNEHKVRTHLIDSHHLPWLADPQPVAAALTSFVAEHAA